ncbi:hypothetical protein [Capnocytophaga sputigena]|uniref:hypothetical protein n=1 Tax=Capnocytophaga sputigena TaxID=1019 RepID=UPI0028D205D9|nr:hypothetical protein [Capnocytophaga sputigena]
MKTLIPKTTVWYIFIALIAPKLLLILYYALYYKSLFFLEVWEENSIFLLKSFVISYSVGQFVPFEKLSKAGTIAIALLCLLILPIINIYNFWRIYDEFNIQNHLDYLGLNVIIGILLGVMLHRIAKKEKAIPPMNQINPRIRAILYIASSFWIGAIILMFIIGVFSVELLYTELFSIITLIAGVYTILGAILARSIPFTDYTKSTNFKIGWFITIIAWLLPLVLIYIVGLPIDEKTTLVIYTCISFFPALISGFYLAKKLQKLGKTT